MLIKDGLDFHNVKDTPIIVEVRLVTLLLVKRGNIRGLKY